MILIRSNEADLSTREVIDYLIKKKTKYCKLNDSDKIISYTIQISNQEQSVNFYFNFGKINSKNITSYFYRRGSFRYQHSQGQSADYYSKIGIDEFLSRENYFIDGFINNILEKNINKVGAFSKAHLSKLRQLTEAVNCNIVIPETYICTCKKELSLLIDIHQRIATKGIQESFKCSDKNSGEFYYMFTSIIDNKNVEKVPTFFSPTLFQKYIDKKYELRIFYLKGVCYSMAIFSQINKKTSTDFRRYDDINPNRTISYKLPEVESKKIHKLMQVLKLDTGSIDMLVTKENQFVFLEVNPDGQFGMVSHPCNYFIEREIANVLAQPNERIEL